MLLFSTVLDINESLTKDGFIQLVLEWNQNTPHPENAIQDIAWNGSRNVRYGSDNIWLEIQEYRNGNTIAVRYEKVESDGVIWDTDYVMNFDRMKMAIQLDRSFLTDAQIIDLKFSTPYFITLLIERGYLKDDKQLPIGKWPVFITKDNISLAADVINEAALYDYPVVYVSKNRDGSDPIDVKLLAARLKGTAHVLVQEGPWLNGRMRKACADRNEYFGAVGVYFPHNLVPHQRFFYRAYSGYDKILFNRIIRSVFQYTNIQNVDPLLTWMGVNNAILRDRWSSRGSELLEAEQAKQNAEFAQKLAEKARELAEQQKDRAVREKNESDSLVEMVDEEIADFKKQIEFLTHENERLLAENTGLRNKLSALDSEPVILTGNEDDFFPGEIKDIVLSVLADALNVLSDDRSRSRRADVLRDLIKSNGYEKLLEKKADELKVKLKGYANMSGTLRRYFEGMGFVITEDGKHYRLTYYGDARYHTTLSKTSSDYREGQNIALQIIRDIL